MRPDISWSHFHNRQIHWLNILVHWRRGEYGPIGGIEPKSKADLGKILIFSQGFRTWSKWSIGNPKSKSFYGQYSNGLFVAYDAGATAFIFAEEIVEVFDVLDRT
jgi:hypothetical protein